MLGNNVLYHHSAAESSHLVSSVKKTRSHLDTSSTETHKSIFFFYDTSLSCQTCPGEVDVALKTCRTM